MKGCLSFIIKTVIAVLVFFGLLHLGVIDFVKEKINEKFSPSQEQMIEKTKDIVDLSDIDNEYSIAKDVKILKNRMIIAEHNATGQKMIMIEPKNDEVLTKEAITSDDVQEKIDNAIAKQKIKNIKIDKIEVVDKGKLQGMGQEIPYIKVNVKISNLPIKDLEGIVGVADLDNDKRIIVISASEKGKYSQILTDAFYKKVK